MDEELDAILAIEHTVAIVVDTTDGNEIEPGCRNGGIGTQLHHSKRSAGDRDAIEIDSAQAAQGACELLSRHGDELIAGTAPANDTDCLQLILDPATDPTRQVVTWTGATNRWYSIQEATSMVAGTVWSNRATNLPATGVLNVHTIAMPEAWSFLRLTVAQ